MLEPLQQLYIDEVCQHVRADASETAAVAATASKALSVAYKKKLEKLLRRHRDLLPIPAPTRDRDTRCVGLDTRQPRQLRPRPPAAAVVGDVARAITVTRGEAKALLLKMRAIAVPETAVGKAVFGCTLEVVKAVPAALASTASGQSTLAARPALSVKQMLAAVQSTIAALEAK